MRAPYGCAVTRHAFLQPLHLQEVSDGDGVTRCFQTCEYAAWKEMTKRGETRAGGGSNVFRYNCQPIVEAGEALLVDTRPSSVVMMCRSGGLSRGKGHPWSQRRPRSLSNVSSIQSRRARAKLRPTRVSSRISRLSQPYSCTCCASPQISSAKMIWSRQACLRRPVPRIHQTLPSADRPDQPASAVYPVVLAMILQIGCAL